MVNAGLTGLEYRPEHCALLDSVYNEVLRLTASSSSIRTVLSTTEIGGKQLRRCTKVPHSLPPIAFERRRLGDRRQNVRPRTLSQGQRVSRSRPQLQTLWRRHNLFARGRFLAKREVMTFIALLLHRFEIALAREPGSTSQ